MKTTRILGAIVGALSMSYSLAQDSSITIAVAGPNTGALAQYGVMQDEGAEMAAKRFNAQGGMNGKTIVLKRFDDACEPKQAVAVANQIANEGIKFVIGHMCSSSTLPAADIYNDEGILMITGSSTDPKLSSKGYRTIFRTIGTDLQSAPTSADYIVNVLKPKNIALIHDKQQYGQGLVLGVAQILQEKGMPAKIIEGVNIGQMDFTALITKLKHANIDMIYWGGYHPELGLIMRQGADQGFFPVFMGADGVDNPDLFAITGKIANGLLVTVPKNFASDERNKALIEQFKAEGKDASGPFVLSAYTALQAIVEAANYAKSNEVDDVINALRTHTFQTPIGEINFTQEGNLKDYQAMIYEISQDGSRTLKTTP